MLHITGLYASLLALIVIWLCYQVVVFRRRQRVDIGDGGDAVGIRHIRAQQNAVEYIPLALILFAIFELNGGNPWMLHGIGTALVLGRLLHPGGLVKGKGATFGRFYGTAITWLVILLLAGLNIGYFIARAVA
ncbi:MAPEG family protein [Marinicella meishanensis]|uniref:MAPEG family protein n=1 Tax=Marinicella meishanensis TaxID=2873263 RepID=UPI001CBE6449|nr:MAPEG family protein [Marinicella sp. NBU2979]